MSTKSATAATKTTAVTTQAVGDSAELVAYRLLQDVLALEERVGRTINRRLLLDAYVECLDAVKGARARKPVPAPVEAVAA